MWMTTQNKLTAHEVKQVHALMHQVHHVDRTFKEPYLSNQYNYFPGMPTFILVYDSASQLAGFTMIYADEAPQGGEVDLIVNVSPAQRNQGIGRMMLNRARAILDDFGYKSINYITEQVFLDANPTFVTKWQMQVTDVEYQMHLAKLTPMTKPETAMVRSMQTADVPALVPSYNEAFGEASSESAQRYLMESLRDPTIASYVLEVSGVPVGYCAIDIDQFAYIFGVFVDAAYRNRGYGQFLITEAIAQVQAQGWQRVVTGVEGDNQAAHRLYERVGFQDETQIVTLKSKNF
ncbi:GNAT family N-acetyltransferase [Weissella viridescens]|uniref:GNAT family N-acetyltransferase n=1 Tax=Weissella viridescens TaxID=1629 RepID=A0A3P2RM79_WEIVI|nr:GNAT family N-acetyltransferase [Weissella viridescens]RRG18802.1 GNAT family N-acetyltransferase [Weissella viridescens]